MACPYTIADLLPHARPMILLDEVLDWSDSSVRACVCIRDDARFAVPDRGVPAHVGIEFMAQACGVFAGLEAKSLGHPVHIGFLLGSRRYLAICSWFAPGQRLEVGVTSVFREGPMAVFDCRIEAGDAVLATAQLTCYQPDDERTVLSGQAMG